MYIIMTARVGTYLSDENIKKMCPLHFMPPGSKTYELFRIASNPQKMAQRPHNGSNAKPKRSNVRSKIYSKFVIN
jgi:hypothetical protein